MAQADAYRQGKQICIQDVSLLDRGEFTVSSINLLVARWLGRSPQEMGPHGGSALASPVGWSGTTQVMVDEHSFCCHSLHCCHLGHFARGPTEQVLGCLERVMTDVCRTCHLCTRLLRTSSDVDARYRSSTWYRNVFTLCAHSETSTYIPTSQHFLSSVFISCSKSLTILLSC